MGHFTIQTTPNFTGGTKNGETKNYFAFVGLQMDFLHIEVNNLLNGIISNTIQIMLVKRFCSRVKVQRNITSSGTLEGASYQVVIAR